ncbi:MAG TPA: hypothetical protein VE172_17725 [Stackebrandtia sp.]|jgi:hypothetical protein|uniref:hypothetical protein n=1 Tax=Stackebrandtia sp. TaxID=2023065 RepID=UPI002D286CA1|nr:hypothetical protein [Stackebrandtia sp.]HZE40646.1 hypothetical protein [Stackebrandtia sp.]
MTAIDRLTDEFLKLAARRWPADVRDERRREWSAEIYYLRHDSGRSRSGRAWAQLRYAFSLAASPPVGDENRVPRGWRELLPRLGRRLWPVAAMFGMGVICRIIGWMLPNVIITATAPAPGAGFSDRFAPLSIVAGMTVLAVEVGLFCWLGVLVGRRLPLIPGSGGPLAHARSAAVATIALGAGALAVDAIAQSPFIGDPNVIIKWTWLYAPLIWAIAFWPVPWLAVTLTRRGGPRVGRLGAALAGSAVLGLTIAATLVIDPSDRTVYPDQANTFSRLMSNMDVLAPLVIASGFVLWYAITSRRATPLESVARPPLSVAGREFPRHRAIVGLSCVVLGLAVWAVDLAYATPEGVRQEMVAESQFVFWASELRHASILVIGLGLALALVGRGRPMPAATVAGAALLTTDTIMDAANREGWRGLVGAVAIGGCVVATAWWLGRTLQIAPPDAARVRRAYIGIAVTAAMCAPVILVQSSKPEGSAAPVVFPASTTTITVTMAAIAGVCAQAARRRQTRTRDTYLVLAIPVVLLGAAGAASGTAVIDIFERFNLGAFNMGAFGAFLCVPFSVYTVAVIWWERVRRPATAAVIWGLIGLTGVAVTLAAILVFGITLSFLIAAPLMRLQGAGYPADGGAVLPGMFILAVTCAVVTAFRMVRSPRSWPSSSPTTVAEASPG